MLLSHADTSLTQKLAVPGKQCSTGKHELETGHSGAEITVPIAAEGPATLTKCQPPTTSQAGFKQVLPGSEYFWRECTASQPLWTQRCFLQSTVGGPVYKLVLDHYSGIRRDDPEFLHVFIMDVRLSDSYVGKVYDPVCTHFVLSVAADILRTEGRGVAEIKFDLPSGFMPHGKVEPKTGAKGLREGGDTNPWRASQQVTVRLSMQLPRSCQKGSNHWTLNLLTRSQVERDVMVAIEKELRK